MILLFAYYCDEYESMKISCEDGVLAQFCNLNLADVTPYICRYKLSELDYTNSKVQTLNIHGVIAMEWWFRILYLLLYHCMGPRV